VLHRAGDSDTVRRVHAAAENMKDGGKPDLATGMLGASLTAARSGKALSDMPALEPYRGKPALRNLRGEDGNVGIIRSPVRAIVLPDHLAFVLTNGLGSPACFQDHRQLPLGNRSPPKCFAKASASSGLAKQNTTRSLSSRRMK
jgi:hypothetical protein